MQVGGRAELTGISIGDQRTSHTSPRSSSTSSHVEEFKQQPAAPAPQSSAAATFSSLSDSEDSKHPKASNNNNQSSTHENSVSKLLLQAANIDPEQVHHKLGQFAATAIAGNDITSSCLYVAGICAYYAGIWAPIALLLVSGCVLYIFRAIYSEVITALPVNGGTYTVLLNTASKPLASLAGSLTILSYVATAVVSSAVAVSYLQDLVPDFSSVWGPVLILGFFCVLTIIGIKDSARVAIVIFIFHLTTMVILIVDCFVFAIGDGFSVLADNWNSRMATLPNGAVPHRFFPGVILGFGSAMLGISGFETSANFVEEQQRGVFPKTLRNMWWAVGILNPTLSFLSLCVLPLPTIMGFPLDADGRPQNNALLIEMANQEWLKTMISLDAFLVLCGATLTGFVGVDGLIRRMAMDDVLPKILLKQNKWFKTNHVALSGFFLTCVSLFFICGMNIYAMAGVYTVSFLSVMCLFCVGNLILKYKRSRLRREFHAKLPLVFLGLFACVSAIIINVVNDASILIFWLLFYCLILFMVGMMFQKFRVLRIFVNRAFGESVEQLPSDEDLQKFKGVKGFLVRHAVRELRRIKEASVIFFVKHPDIRLMNKAVAYVRENETSQGIKFVHVCNQQAHPKLLHQMEEEDGQHHQDHDGDVRNCTELFEADVATLQKVYPSKRLTFELVRTEEAFDGPLLRKLSAQMGVRNDKMFISCPSIKFPHDIAELGGVRLITS
eukprot:TRINITY_DN1959_c0_g1_i3.p1 TRINITY_DN1959_c0_g1~~TRINITY_DN1959_c0_g1_i3.p1  ORF type:complete len:725 (+),score=157.48 TRINITY_DN1959_c0_g1_i3:696-2870(+)